MSGATVGELIEALREANRPDDIVAVNNILAELNLPVSARTNLIVIGRPINDEDAKLIREAVEQAIATDEKPRFSVRTLVVVALAFLITLAGLLLAGHCSTVPR